MGTATDREALWARRRSPRGDARGALSRVVTAAAVFSVVLLAATACGGAAAEGDSAQEADSLTVVATTTVLGDVAENVACGTATVEVLMSPGQDPHAFELSARQAVELRDADLVIANGLDLEQGFADVLLEARDAGTRVLFVAEEVDPIPYGSGGVHDEEEPDAHGTFDPHVWMDPVRMAEGARLIGAELARIAGDDTAAACAAEYSETLEVLDAEIAASLEAIPAASRKLIANHEALGYFAAHYGFEVVGVVIPSGSTLAEPSASDIVELVESIEREGVPAIFAETTATSKLAEAVAEETGREVEVVHLYTGSLGEEGSAAGTYIELIVTNAERISEALAD